ncbi:MAG: A/G-specific adenine glycosylase [Armatimonadota bacterium]|nr:A/G-specific adenine glycosylase [Armatimonadota bacterium]
MPELRQPCEIRAESIRRLLLAWWRCNRRDFPWRRTRDPYKVAVAELMLRRTRAEVVERVYREFVRRWPDPRALSQARAGAIVATLRPLGLRWRARNIVSIARILRAVPDPGAVFRQPETLAGLPGVGEYVSAAVASFALGRAVPVVDTNTARIASRILGLQGRREWRRSRAVRELLVGIVRGSAARGINLALLDLAALVCLPHAPRCRECPISRHCRTGR